jgi:MOSC domain-containing protein YiiM
MSFATVVALYRKPAPGMLEPVESLQAHAGEGFEGDYCRGRRSRQALLVSTSCLQELGLRPGDLREQLTVDLPDLQALPPGARLRVGPVEFEIECDCTPCTHMAECLGEDPANFKSRTAFKRGMLAKVVGEGKIRVGDLVRVEGGD